MKAISLILLLAGVVCLRQYFATPANLQLLGVALSLLSAGVVAVCVSLYRELPINYRVWPFVIFFIYMGILGCVSMYVGSLPAPCVARGDCVATEQRGIYVHD